MVFFINDNIVIVIGMALSSLIDRFMELGYEPDFVENDGKLVCFNSVKNGHPIIKIRYSLYYSDDPMYRYEIMITLPGYTHGYCTSIESITESLFKEHGILQSVPELPTKGVFDEGQ